MRRRRNGEGPYRYAAPAALPEDEEFKTNRKKKDSHKSLEEEKKVEKEVKRGGGGIVCVSRCMQTCMQTEDSESVTFVLFLDFYGNEPNPVRHFTLTSPELFK